MASRRRTSITGRYRTPPPLRTRGRVERRFRRGAGARLGGDAALGTNGAARSASPPPAAGIVGFKPRYGAVPIDGVFPAGAELQPRRPDGPRRRRLHRPDASPRPQALSRASLKRLFADLARRGRLVRAGAEPLVRARVEAAAALVPGSRRGRVAGFRGADCGGVHARGRRRPSRALRGVWRALRREHPGEDRAVHRRRGLGGRGRGAARGHEYDGVPRRRSTGFDLIIAPTLVFVAPPADVDEVANASASSLHLPVQSARLAGARTPVRAGGAGAPRVRPGRRPAGSRRARARRGPGSSKAASQ